MGRLTHPTRSSIRCAFVTFATALAAATGGMMAWVWEGEDKSKLVIPDGARSAEIGDLVQDLERGPGSSLRSPGMTRGRSAQRPAASVTESFWPWSLVISQLSPTFLPSTCGAQPPGPFGASDFRQILPPATV